MATKSAKSDQNDQPAEEPKPVWNTATHGPVPEGREDVCQVEGPPGPAPQFDPSGNVVGDEKDASDKG